MKTKKLQLCCRDPQFENKQPILYFVTTIRDVGAIDDHDRCIGYYPSLKSARSVIKENSASLEESGFYQYAVIEAFGFGWYPQAKTEEWYQLHNGNTAIKIKKPKQYSNLCNFGIG